LKGSNVVVGAADETVAAAAGNATTELDARRAKRDNVKAKRIMNSV